MTTAAEILAQSRIGRRAARARRAKPDGGLATLIVEYLTARGIRAERLNSASLVIPEDEAKGHARRFLRATFPGCPDVVALFPGHGTVWIEAKRPNAKLRADQVEFRNACLRAGAPHVVCRDLRDLDPYLAPTRRRS